MKAKDLTKEYYKWIKLKSKFRQNKWLFDINGIWSRQELFYAYEVRESR